MWRCIINKWIKVWPGDNVELNIKDLDKNNMSRSGDVMVDKKDSTLGRTKEFNAQFQVLDITKEIKEGFSTIEFVRCDSATLRIPALEWTRERKLAVLIVNVQRSRAVNGCDQERKTHWSRGGVNITPGFGPVSICMFPFVMHSAQW